MGVYQVPDPKIHDIIFKNTRRIKDDLENKLKDLEKDLNNDDQLQKYNEIKFELEKIYEKFVEGAKVSSKCT